MRYTDQDPRRVVIESVRPQVDGGRFTIKRIVGDEVIVEADAFADGHEVLTCRLQYRHSEEDWRELPLSELGNDRWRAAFRVEVLGVYQYRIVAWVDRFHTWRADLKKRADAGQDLSVDLLIGSQLVEATAFRVGQVAAHQPDVSLLDDVAVCIAARGPHARLDQAGRYAAAMDPSLLAVMDRHADRSHATISPEYSIVVDDVRAAFGAWYELFPRCYSPATGKHATLRDLIAHLPYVAGMGFDVLYLPPIHPIGRAFRKGKNNQEKERPDDVGSPC